MQEQISIKFKELFQTEGGFFASPGRINLIGEHTDYNGGFVFPGAVDKGMIAEIKPNGTGTVRAYALDLSDYAEFGLTEEAAPKASWARYIFGVCREIIKRGGNIQGFDTVFAGDVPLGAGMSSSAALESTFAFALNELFALGIDKFELAKIGQSTEHNYCGVKCGIMDQFASAMGKKDNEIFLDTATLNFEYAPVKLENASIVVTNSKVKHSLVDSAYNTRRSECETALKELQTVLDIKTLGDLTREEFEANVSAIKDPVRVKRARHAVYENIRTIDAIESLKKGDINTFGKLMIDSHTSLRDDYEVSCEEIDILVEEALKIDGVIGSRITGGGFGGCTVSIVLNDSIEEFKDKVSSAYTEKTGIVPEIYLVSVGDGPSKL